jgi:hypothetical protein
VPEEWQTRVSTAKRRLVGSKAFTIVSLAVEEQRQPAISHYIHGLLTCTQSQSAGLIISAESESQQGYNYLRGIITEELPHTFDQAILCAWQAELKATRDPIIKELRLQQEPELLPRFAEHYQQLKALRRRVRRLTTEQSAG